MKRLRWGLMLVAAAAACGSPDEAPPPSSPAPPTTGPTFYRDVEPIVLAKCASCHAADGAAGFPLDAETAKFSARAMAVKVRARDMPPWPPGPLGPPIVDERVLTEDEIAVIERWSEAGSPLGDPADHRDPAPKPTFDMGRPPDLVLTTEDYVPPPGMQTDETRCFVVDLPAGTPARWVTGVRWVPGTPAAIHHVGGAWVDAASGAAARARSRRDGRPGFECAGGLGAFVQRGGGLGASGAGNGTGTRMPKGTGVYLAEGATLIVSVHYVIGHLQKADRSGVELWLARDGERAGLRPLVETKASAPSELPCPTGVASDPSDRCSRAFGIASVKSAPPAEVRASNDRLLATCNTTLPGYYARLPFSPAPQETFPIPTECVSRVPYDGVVHVVHGHMHTRGVASRIEVKNDDGSWKVLLDIPRWRWAWEGSYLLREGVPVKAGQELRVSCTFDNGTAIQWSAVTGEPGHDGKTVSPLQPPAYVVGGPERGAEMCEARVTIERAPFQNESWRDVCAEAQRIYDALCGDGAVDLTASACTGKFEETSVLLLSLPEDEARERFCPRR